jgi:hypothetical protein
MSTEPLTALPWHRRDEELLGPDDMWVATFDNEQDAEYVLATLDAARAAQDVAGREPLPLNDANGPWCGCGNRMGHAVPNEDCNPVTQPATPPPDALREALRLHYVTKIDCDPVVKTDTVRCNCSVWTGTPQPSIGQAVAEYADHFVAALRAQGVVQSPDEGAER